MVQVLFNFKQDLVIAVSGWYEMLPRRFIGGITFHRAAHVKREWKFYQINFDDRNGNECRNLKLQKNENLLENKKEKKNKNPFDVHRELSNVIIKKKKSKQTKEKKKNLITAQQLLAIHQEKRESPSRPVINFILALVATHFLLSFTEWMKAATRIKHPNETREGKMKRKAPSAVVVLFILDHIKNAQDLMNGLAKLSDGSVD